MGTGLRKRGAENAYGVRVRKTWAAPPGRSGVCAEHRLNAGSREMRVRSRGGDAQRGGEAREFVRCVPLCECTVTVAEKMRLQKFLAHAGVASRRAAEELIARGKVRVNGKIVRELGTSVSETDRVDVSGTPIVLKQEPTYLVLHKPVNVMTTMRDPEGRRTVADLIPKGLPRVVPVGRLDYDTSGVLLLTNDGELANVLTHPRFGVEKTYRAVVKGRLLPDEIRRLQSGVWLEEFKAGGAAVRVVATRRDTSVLDITIHEGKNRQVRRMFEAVGHPVVALARLRFGPLRLGDLPPGQTRPVTARELSQLRHLLP
jgi:23S rRNA pseudouridine2605 synthase